MTELEAVNALFARAQADYMRPWTPNQEPTENELLAAYISRLEERALELEKFKSDEMWRRDQASEHRMGL